MGSGSSSSHRYHPVSDEKGTHYLSRKKKPKKHNDQSVIRFVDFNQFKARRCFPSYPHDWRMTTDVEEIDREQSIIIFISHAWLKNERHTGGDSSNQPKSFIDDEHNSKYRLCVEGIERILETHITEEITKCYLWIDYSCINPAIEQKSQLFFIMEFCDLIFTPVLDVDHQYWRLPPGNTIDYYTQYQASLWNGGTDAYLKRACCRVEMFYGTNVPLFLGPHPGNKNTQHTSSNGDTNLKTVNGKTAHSSATAGTTTITLKKSGSNNNNNIKKPVKTIIVSPSGKHNQAGKAATSKKPIARHFKFRNLLAYHMAQNARPHMIFGTKELLMYTQYNPLAGFISNDDEMKNIHELVEYLKPKVDETIRTHVKYVGEVFFKHGQQPLPHGEGEMRYPNGDIYRGSLHEGQRWGKGIMMYKTGDVYDGMWEADCMHGMGTFKYINGHVYEGTWKDNLRDGKGKYYHYLSHWDYVGTIAALELQHLDDTDLGDNDPNETETQQSPLTSNERGGTFLDLLDEHDNENSPSFAPTRHNSTVLTVNTDTNTNNSSNTNVYSNSNRNSRTNANRYASYTNSSRNASSSDSVHNAILTALQNAKSNSSSSNSNANHQNSSSDSYGHNNSYRRGGNHNHHTNHYHSNSYHSNPSSSPKARHNNSNRQSSSSSRYVEPEPIVHRYEGQWKKDVKQGQGKFYYPNGDFYDGAYEDNMKHGPGRYVAINGDIYVGNFYRDLIHGRGKLVYGNGEVYEGDFENDKRHGQGRFYHLSGDVYDGEFQGDLIQGRGVMVYSNGEKYDGEWINEQRDGEGTFYYVDGTRYEGQFSQNNLAGIGTMIYTNGTRHEYENGKRKPYVNRKLILGGLLVTGMIVAEKLI